MEKEVNETLTVNNEPPQINEDGKAYNMRDKVLWVPIVFAFIVALILIF